ncbi:DgyrCDS5221 [Dimorphilus gyrociliatus]|uniref:DgyrCDS5221 n=1 Tax=Dimorphilus gyrociliatus TaxID=2664684 RepID=A0A7I8VLW9_9ANNE|nr:DgyrCDS5221 [Dimorphilus gyrociliatus]
MNRVVILLFLYYSMVDGDYLDKFGLSKSNDIFRLEIPKWIKRIEKENPKMSWSNCGSSSDLIKLDKLEIQPSKIKIPGNVTVSASGSLKEDITSGIKLDLKIEKKILVWIKIPCEDKIGSCTYDVCSMLKTIFPGGKCPDVFVKAGVPCHCPFLKGNYSLKKANVFVNPSIKIPSWLEEGEYKIQLDVSHQGKRLMCLKMDLSLA